VRVLRPEPQGQLIVEGAVLGDDAAHLDRRRRESLLKDAFLDDHVGGRERFGNRRFVGIG
jgi:hypothetical protein